MEIVDRCIAHCKERSAAVKNRIITLPWIQFLITCSNVFINQLGAILIFPFLPFMIHSFFPQLKVSELGQAAGILGSAYFIGALPGTIVLGLLSDFVGRRPMIILGSLIGIIFEILFGFSTTLAWALTTRIFWGILDGTLAVVKAYLPEITDESNQAPLFTVLSVAILFGKHTGYILGGALVYPASKFPLLRVEYFCQFPYLLPCLVGAALGILTILGGILTLNLKRHGDEKKSKAKSNNVIYCCSISPEVPASDGDTIALLPKAGSTEDVSPKEDMSSSQRRTKWTSLLSFIVCYKKCLSRSLMDSRKSKKPQGRGVMKRLRTLMCLIFNWRVVLVTLLHAITSNMIVMYIELIPLLLVNDGNHGGYNMDETEITVLSVVLMLLILPFQLLVFPCVIISIGYRNIFRLGTLLLAVTIFFLPSSTVITGPIPAPIPFSTNPNKTDFCTGHKIGGGELHNTMYDDHMNSIVRITWRVWLWVCTLCTIMNAGRILVFCGISILVNNATMPPARGTVNGINESVSALGNIIGALIGAKLFAWTENNGLGWPFNFHFLFIITTVILLIAFFLSFLLPKSLEHPRTEEPPAPANSDTEEEEEEEDSE